MKYRFFWLLFLVGTLQSNAQMPHGNGSPRRRDDLILRPTNSPQCQAPTVAPQVLSDGRLLFGVVDTVYMVAADGAVKWKYVTKGPEQPLSLAASPVFNSQTDEIGVIGCDLFFVRLDAATGKEKWRTRVNGSSEYKQIAAYGSGFLLVLNSHGEDEVQYWGDSEDDFRQADFPSGATLVVSGAKVYAVRSLGRSIRVREIHLLPSR